jgi:RHS repeat-associated protein
MLHYYKHLFCISVVFFYIRVGAQVTPTGNSVPVHTVPIATLPEPYPSGTLINYIRSWQPLVPLTSDATVLAGDNLHVQQSSQYIDGLGRPVQTVTKGITPSGKDLVAPIVYDAFGRETYKYLPYASGTDGLLKTDPFSAAIYGPSGTMSQYYPGENVFYSQTNFEASPLDRVLKTLPPGNSWAGNNRGISMSYEINAADEVRVWDIGFTAGAVPSSPGTYGAGELYRTVTTDEQAKRVVEYKDKEGQVVLKKVEIDHTGPAIITSHSGWLCTYYVYDDLNQLRFVIPPKAVSELVKPTVNWDLSNQPIIVNELCFQYRYDGGRRMIEKKVPGAGWVYLVYDKRDRLVFTQDANMSSHNWWLTTLYDELNRPIQTGMLTYNGDRTALQSYVDGLTVGTSTSTNTGTIAGTPADLYVSEHDGRALYRATNKIVFEGNLEGENFETEIIAPDGASFTSNQTVSFNPLPTGSAFVPLTYTYYDNYDWTSKSYSAANNSKLGSGNNIYGEPLPATASAQVKGVVTGSRVRVIENANDLSQGPWLETASFYDDKGRVIQVQADSYKKSTDIVTSRYDFTGKVISRYQVHTNPSGNMANNRVYTEMDYDHGGRLIETRKTLNDDNSTTRVIAHNSYDALGQLQTKQLGQKTDDNGNVITGQYLETQDYAYNIRGWLKGLNWKDYNNTGVTKTSAITNRWFAMDLSYDWGYNQNQYNGNIAGMRWQSGGDKEERSYGYGYDAANRLLSADFTQYTSNTWNTDANIDFTVKMGTGGLNDGTAYDENGNIIQMQQWGIKVPGSKDPIDNLSYAYFTGTNKLSSVTDAVTADNKLGDFTDKNTGSDDYGYDANGNLLTDKNKRINGSTGLDLPANAGAIQYNYLNLPWQIAVKDENNNPKGTITYIYDATGNKLEKRVAEDASVANNNTEKHTYTAYLGGNIYENNVLKFFGQEEGRIRPKRNSSGNIEGWVYDYFLKDHLGNVRMVLTDEHQTSAYPVASLEAATLTIEKDYYDIPDGGRVHKNTVPGYPSDTYTNPNDYIQQLNGNGQKTGSSIVLKVMAGDKVNIRANSWYRLNGASPGSPVNLLAADLIGSLAGGIAGAGAGSHSATQLQENSSLLGSAGDFLTRAGNDYAANGSGRPKAYLNYVLFDEQFKVVVSDPADGKNTGLEQAGSDEEFKTHSVTEREMTKNGYLYIYVSNETPNINVFFDNLQVTHIRGPLTEETHYYPFGLTMEGISSKALTFGNPENKFKYNEKELQSKEFSDGSGLEWTYFGARMYDQQVGRWHKTDGKAEAYFATSPYVYALNQPVNAVDPDGNVVIFINGNHFGTSGKDYWRQTVTEKRLIGSTLTGINSFGIPSYHDVYTTTTRQENFDEQVMTQLGDKNARYYDGSGGGWHPMGDFARESASALGRWKNGEEKGYAEAADIIANLERDKNNNIVETIKIITHSMGGAYGNGFIAGLQRYVSMLPIEIQKQIKIALAADFDPYQAGSFHANSNVKTQQFKHANGWNILGMGWLANENEEGAEQVPVNKNDNSDHSIFSFFSDISKLAEGTYTWDNVNQKWVKQ